MSTINRAFVPPTNSEYDPSTGSTDIIIWSLGSFEHPWKNIYIMDTDQGNETIDVYERLKLTSIIPNDNTRKPGSVLTANPDKSLKWTPLDTLFKDHDLGVKGASISSVLQNYREAVPYAIYSYIPSSTSEVMEPIELRFLKNVDFTGTNIRNKLGDLPVYRAIADQNNVVFATKDLAPKDKDGNRGTYNYGYVFTPLNPSESRIPVPQNPYYINEELYLATHRNITRDGETKEYALHDVAFTGEYKDLKGLPGGGWASEAYVNTQIESALNPVVQHISNIDDNLEKHANIHVIYRNNATENTEGVVTVKEGNGLKATLIEHIPDPDNPEERERYYFDPMTGQLLPWYQTQLSVSLATDKKPGTVYIPGGNGLTLGSDGKVTLAKATTSVAGTVKLGIQNSYNNTFTDVDSIPNDGLIYLYSGEIKNKADLAVIGSDQVWMIKKITYTNQSSKVFIWAQSVDDPRLELRTNDNGNRWFAPYATWHA